MPHAINPHETDNLSSQSDLPYLSADCVNALASTLMHELDVRTDLELPIRNALINTAAAIAKHGHDCATVEAVTDQLFHRIGSTGDTLE